MVPASATIGIAPPPGALARKRRPRVLRPLRSLGDEGLGALAALGDEEAFAVIVARYRAAIVRYCHAILSNEADAEDAAQTTIVNARVALRAGGGAVALRPWLFRIAHNEAISLLRRRRPSATLVELDGVGPAAGSGPDSFALRARMQGLVADLHELPERQRAALLMRELVGLSYGEISGALGCTPAAVMQSVFEARRNLQQLERGRGLECLAVQHSISDGDRRRLRGRELRAHLDDCGDCAAFEASIAERRRELCLLFPVAVAAKGALLVGGGWLGSGGVRVIISSVHGAGAASGVQVAAVAAVLAGAGGITVGQIVAHRPASRPGARIVAVRAGSGPELAGEAIPGAVAERSRPVSAVAAGARSTPLPVGSVRASSGRGPGFRSIATAGAWPLIVPVHARQHDSPAMLPPATPTSSPSPPTIAPREQPTPPLTPGGAGAQITPGAIAARYGQAGAVVTPGAITARYGQAGVQITPGCVREQFGSFVLQWGPACPPAAAPSGG
ncbi:MAG: RNA polymerase sigma factor [Solirubrobacteraceae bacterium]